MLNEFSNFAVSQSHTMMVQQEFGFVFRMAGDVENYSYFTLLCFLAAPSLGYCKSRWGPSLYGSVGGQGGENGGWYLGLTGYESSYLDGFFSYGVKAGAGGSADHLNYDLGLTLSMYAYLGAGVDLSYRYEANERPTPQITLFGGILLLNIFYRHIFARESSGPSNEFGAYLHFPLTTDDKNGKSWKFLFF